MSVKRAITENTHHRHDGYTAMYQAEAKALWNTRGWFGPQSPLMDQEPEHEKRYQLIFFLQ